MRIISKTNERDLRSMKKLKPIAARLKGQYTEGARPADVAATIEELVRNASPSLILRMCASHRAMILSGGAVKELERAEDLSEDAGVN